MFPVFVDRIPKAAEVSDLRELFSRFGSIVDVTIISSHGFVNFNNSSDAVDAIGHLNGFRFLGEKLVVEASQELEDYLKSKNERSYRSRSPIGRFRERPKSPSQNRGGTRPRSRTRDRSRSRTRQRTRSPGGRRKRSRSASREGSKSRKVRSRSRSRSQTRRSKSRNKKSRSTSRSSSRDRKKSKHSKKKKHKKVKRKKSRSQSLKLSPISSRSPTPERSTSADQHPSIHDSTDLREVLKKRHLSSDLQNVKFDQNFQIQVEQPGPSYSSEERKIILTSSTSNHQTVDESKIANIETQQLYIGNLFNPVEREDLERLVESFGKVLEIKLLKNQAIVIIECGRRQAEEAIEALDSNYWMDNTIRVTFDKNGNGRSNENPPETEIVKTGNNSCSDVSNVTLPVLNESASATSDLEKSPRTFEVFCNAVSKTFLKDICDMFIMFGSVDSSKYNPKTKTAHLVLNLNSEEVEWCISETNGKIYKGQPIKVKLADPAISEPVESEEPETFKDEKKILERTLIAYCDTKAKTFLSDMRNVVFPKFGTIRSCKRNSDGQTISIVMYSSELDAVRCINETNNITYKGQPLRVKFEDDSLEDSPQFRRQYLDLFRNYPSELNPNKKAKSSVSETTSNNGSSNSQSQLPIGILPPSSSLGAFGALPNNEALNFIIENIRRASQSSSQAPPITIPEIKPTPTLYSGPTLNGDPMYLTDVDGQIHSVNSKIILIKFSDGFNYRFARLIPGQMYIDGKQCLGYIIKNNKFHSWPQEVRFLLQQGALVKMDVNRMNETEEKEVQQIASEIVTYGATLIWKSTAVKPTDHDLTVSRVHPKTWVLKGVLASLYPKWGILRTASGDVFFEAHHLYVDNARNVSSTSLLNFLELGDVLAVMCRSSDYLEISEIARSAPGFEGSTDSLAFFAQLVWNIPSEIDPYSIDKDDVEIKCRFITTSSTLNCPLPLEREARYTSLSGIVEELHLPAGGIVTLDPGTSIDGHVLSDDQRHVYFHRSRIYLNGIKIPTNFSLDSSLVPGDQVSVDVTLNQDPVTQSQFVASQTYWVALSLRAQTTDRGVCIANTLRMEGADPNLKNVCLGRIVYLRKPELGGAVVEGVAVIDSGEFSGQRVEFDRSQCHLFGNRLICADLSYIFGLNEVVYIQVKSYNSYLVEKLWVGSPDEKRPEDGVYLRKYLFDHGLDELSFQYLLRGKFPNRPFVPLSGQTFRGRLRGLSNDVDGSAVKMTIEASDVGEPLLVEAGRQDLFVYGHHMGKADLRYLLADEEVLFEMHPVFERNDSGLTTMPQASIVWLGDQESRPCYIGQAVKPAITPKMDSMLWTFVKGKGMDEKMFRALVEGRLPPKTFEHSGAAGSVSQTPEVDSETLAQAALLKQMKERFGPKACLKAMMLLMQESQTETGPGSSDSLSAEESVDKDDESVKKAKELAEKMMKSGNDS